MSFLVAVTDIQDNEKCLIPVDNISCFRSQPHDRTYIEFKERYEYHGIGLHCHENITVVEELYQKAIESRTFNKLKDNFLSSLDDVAEGYLQSVLGRENDEKST